MSNIGLHFRITSHRHPGGRPYMEDFHSISYRNWPDNENLLYSYFGIFDGHGGKEAAQFAKDNLLECIISQENFWMDDDQLVLKAIKNGFVQCHQKMWHELDKWPKTPKGHPSTAGTTASVAFIRRGKIYLGHVGDSAIIMGYQDPDTAAWKAKQLTKFHKPQDPTESARIHEHGGKVATRFGIPRVVWRQPPPDHRGCVRRSTKFQEVPFLAVARSLGDLWSYDAFRNKYVISPIPDVEVIEIDANIMRCFILASDGLWDVFSAQNAVDRVCNMEMNNQQAKKPESGKMWVDPARCLVNAAIKRWLENGLRPDNTSAIVVIIDPPTLESGDYQVPPPMALAPVAKMKLDISVMLEGEKSSEQVQWTQRLRPKDPRKRLTFAVAKEPKQRGRSAKAMDGVKAKQQKYLEEPVREEPVYGSGSPKNEKLMEDKTFPKHGYSTRRSKLTKLVSSAISPGYLPESAKCKACEAVYYSTKETPGSRLQDHLKPEVATSGYESRRRRRAKPENGK